MLALARALVSRPRLLMLDEPSLGLAPTVVQELFGIVGVNNEEGLRVLVVEQNAKSRSTHLMRTCSRSEGRGVRHE